MLSPYLTGQLPIYVLGAVIFWSRKVAKSPAHAALVPLESFLRRATYESHDQSWTIPGRIMGNQKFTSKKPMSQD